MSSSIKMTAYVLTFAILTAFGFSDKDISMIYRNIKDDNIISSISSKINNIEIAIYMEKKK